MKYGTRQGFFPPSWAPLGFQLTACESQQPFRPASRSASRSASSCKGRYPPIAHCRWSAGTWLSFPSLLPLQDAAEPGCPPQQLSQYTSGRSFCITALLFLPRFMQDDFACGAIHPQGFYGIGLAHCHPRAGQEGVSQLLPGSTTAPVAAQRARRETGRSHDTLSPALSAPASPGAPSVGDLSLPNLQTVACNFPSF